MSIILPAVVLAQAAIILWLLGARARLNRLVQSSDEASQQASPSRTKTDSMPEGNGRPFPSWPKKQRVGEFALAESPGISHATAIDRGPDHVSPVEKKPAQREQHTRQPLAGRFCAATNRAIHWAREPHRRSRPNDDGKPQLCVQAGEDHPTVYADKVQLQQVTLNLLLNAFDAMSDIPASRRVVVITLTRPHDGMARIAVRDCGHGLVSGRLDSAFYAVLYIQTPWPGTWIVNQPLDRGASRRAPLGREQC